MLGAALNDFVDRVGLSTCLRTRTRPVSCSSVLRAARSLCRVTSATPSADEPGEATAGSLSGSGYWSARRGVAGIVRNEVVGGVLVASGHQRPRPFTMPPGCSLMARRVSTSVTASSRWCRLPNRPPRKPPSSNRRSATTAVMIAPTVELSSFEPVRQPNVVADIEVVTSDGGQAREHSGQHDEPRDGDQAVQDTSSAGDLSGHPAADEICEQEDDEAGDQPADRQVVVFEPGLVPTEPIAPVMLAGGSRVSSAARHLPAWPVGRTRRDGHRQRCHAQRRGRRSDRPAGERSSHGR